MGVTEDFEKFCKNIRMDDDTVETISMSLCRSCHNKIHIELGDRHPSER